MDVTPLIAKDSQVIQGYGPEGIRVSGVLFEAGAVVTSKHSYPLDIANKAVSDLSVKDFSFLSDLPFTPDVFILGTGASIAFLSKELKQQLQRTYNVVPDVMDTGAACRTYNVILSEGRHICAALLPYS